MDVGSTPEKLGPNYPLIQNLGPDPIYVGADSSVSTATGVKVESGQSFNANSPSTWVVSSGTSDVRSIDRGVGIHSIVSEEA